MKNLMKVTLIVAFVVALLGVASAQKANATLIGFDLANPDITSNSTGTYSYDATTHLFISSATPISISYDGSTLGFIDYLDGTDVIGSYSVQFYVDNSGNFMDGVEGDDLLIYADLTDDSTVNPILVLSGDVNNFGWDDSGLFTVDFTFDVTGGSLAGYYTGGVGGNIMTSENNTFLSWEGDSSGTKVKHDTAPVPEPGTIALLGMGLVGLIGAGARRKLKKKS